MPSVKINSSVRPWIVVVGVAVVIAAIVGITIGIIGIPSVLAAEVNVVDVVNAVGVVESVDSVVSHVTVNDHVVNARHVVNAVVEFGVETVPVNVNDVVTGEV